MPDDVVYALWVGSHDAELPERITLRSGVDTYPVSRGEAETSENWLYPVPAPETSARDLIDQLATATAEDAQAVLDREHASDHPRKTVVSAAEDRLAEFEDEPFDPDAAALEPNPPDDAAE
jgi:hypothetical protein